MGTRLTCTHAFHGHAGAVCAPPAAIYEPKPARTQKPAPSSTGTDVERGTTCQLSCTLALLSAGVWRGWLQDSAAGNYPLLHYSGPAKADRPESTWLKVSSMPACLSTTRALRLSPSMPEEAREA